MSMRTGVLKRRMPGRISNYAFRGSEFMDVTHEYPDITVHLTLFNTTIA